MGTSKVYTSLTHSQTSEDPFSDRVISSILSHPVDLGCRVPDSYLNKENADTKPRNLKLNCSISCSYEASYTKKPIKPFDITDLLSKVHLILSISYEDSTFTASGTVIASRYILTAASNVFKREIDREVGRRNIEILAQNDGGSTISDTKVIEICYSKKYPKTGEEDLALLVLDRDIGTFSGSIGVKATEEEEALGKSVYLCGYQTVEENQDEYQIIREADLNFNIFRGFANYSSSIRNFLIGSIFYYQESNKYYAVGLLKPSCSSPPETLEVLHFNSSRVKKLESWIRRCSIKYGIITSLDLSLFPYSNFDLLLKLKSSVPLDLLISLDLSRNSLGSKGAKTLAKLTFKSLRSLNLERNDLGCKGVREIARGKLGNLTHLKLGGNEISSKGSKDLAFGKLKNLIELDLQDNMIGDEGVIFISIGNFTGLTVLNLSKNELGPIAAKGLAKGNLVNLRSLNLACNKIGNNGALILAQGNTVKLQALDVSSNFIGIEGAAALSYGKLVEVNELNLEKNNIRERTAARLSTRNTSNFSVYGIKGGRNLDISNYSVSYNGNIS
jgi:hypothetical protein